MARETKINMIKKVSVICAVIGASLFGMHQDSYALSLYDSPDFTAQPLSIKYNYNNPGDYTAHGPVSFYNALPLSPDTVIFDLFADIGVGGSLNHGNFSIYNDPGKNGFDTSDTLYLSGALTSLYTDLSTSVLEFCFTPQDGTYLGEYTKLGSVGAIILGSGIDTSGFTTSMYSTANGSADIGTPVPEPSSIALLLLGTGGLYFLRRRKSDV